MMYEYYEVKSIARVFCQDGTGMGSANERTRYMVTPSLIAWAHSQNDLCVT